MGPVFFMVMHTGQLIKTIVLIGDAPKINNYSVSFLQAGFGIDFDFVPWKNFPQIKIDNDIISSQPSPKTY